MEEIIAKKWIRQREFQGMPCLEDFELVNETLSESLKDGEILIEAEWLSVDPFMRGNLFNSPDSPIMPGSQVASVKRSKHQDYPVGTKVVAYVGWRDRTICNPDTFPQPVFFHKLPDFKGLSDSYALGALGLPGNTALFGIEKVLKVKQGGILLVNSAGGAVGSIACQIGLLKGCEVIAFTGSQEKTSWLKQALNVKLAFNYNSDDIGETLTEHAPNGIDYYFDNVGGDFSYKVLKHMKPHGKVALCGAISTYNQSSSEKTEPLLIPFDYWTFIYNHVIMEGFRASEYESEWLDGITTLRDLILDGKILPNETIAKGFEAMPEAFINIFKGGNIGKQIVKV
ncbi:Prostaglandin reductase 1 [Orchesella cincta]|uniref:15-oxoprostaglandin 13-reductase n=1 Tax=Orchesella cincta TaxID=48709 RepID=A0A1D2M6N5_ORCCI|nr:Prostaglandin reductase 1 [Orchesella cincta]